LAPAQLFPAASGGQVKGARLFHGRRGVGCPAGARGHFSRSLSLFNFKCHVDNQDEWLYTYYSSSLFLVKKNGVSATTSAQLQATTGAKESNQVR